MTALGYVVVHVPNACDEGVYVERWNRVFTREEAERVVERKGQGDCGFYAAALVPVADLAVEATALADVITIIDAKRAYGDKSARFGADLIAAIIRDALRKHGLYEEVQR